jgi:hypothetical protein
VSHFAAIGFTAADAEAFGALLDGLLRDAHEEKLPGPAHHLLASDESGAQIAFHLEAGEEPCLTPWFAAGSPTLDVETGDLVDDADCAHCGGVDCDFLDAKGTVVTRATVQWLYAQPWRAWLTEPRKVPLRLVAFAHRASAYPDRAAFEAARPLGELKIDDQAFFPIGMFTEATSVTARASVLFAGEIVSVARRDNARGGGQFQHLRVATLPGTLDVVAASVDGEAHPGALVLIEAWLVGTPDLPAPGQLQVLSDP